PKWKFGLVTSATFSDICSNALKSLGPTLSPTREMKNRSPIHSPANKQAWHYVNYHNPTLAEYCLLVHSWYYSRCRYETDQNFSLHEIGHKQLPFSSTTTPHHQLR
ncbi:unnamed protein product, partial [Choristocarpus tenellus]